MKRKIILLITIIFAVSPIYAQEVKSKYGEIFPESVANQPAPLLPGMTAIEQRDYGIDLFVGGMLLHAVVGPGVIVGGYFIDQAIGDGAISTIVAPIAGGAISTLGLGIWIAGAVFLG